MNRRAILMDGPFGALRLLKLAVMPSMEEGEVEGDLRVIDSISDFYIRDDRVSISLQFLRSRDNKCHFSLEWVRIEKAISFDY